MSSTFTGKEKSSLRAVVDLLDEHSLIPKMFEPHIRSARAKLESQNELTASDAAGLCAAAWEFLKKADVESMPCELRDVIESAWKKLLEAQHDQPVLVFSDDGWYVCVNGSIACGPFETEDRARFFWSNRPWPMTCSN
jgi:hypothetical protein